MKLCLLLAAALALSAQPKPRARDLGVPFEGTTGPLNAITDVTGIEVGHTTLIEGSTVRTGVTAVWPRGKSTSDPVFGGFFSQNGNGDMTGTHWLEESGFLDGPVLITNTHSVGVVRDAYLAWLVNHKRQPGTNTFDGGFYTYPIVAETYDGFLNDINGFHVKPEHVFAALDGAKSGAVLEGGVGGGTGMVCYSFKGGIGTSSRRVTGAGGDYTVGVLVQANFGRRPQLLVAGVPVGQEIPQPPARAGMPADDAVRGDLGSIIIGVATDAPLLPHQLKRLARRATLGMARTGGMSGNGSGDIFLAFSTANPDAFKAAGLSSLQMVSNEQISPLFDATVYATEEAIINALVAADTMVGIDGHRVERLPHEQLKAVLKKYNRLAP
jgi:L-aminopeptidase/D-esterase-like protein